MRKALLSATFASLAAMLAGVATGALARECRPGQAASPATHAQTGIKFFNDTRLPMRIYWADFKGGLKPMSDWIPPGGGKGFGTFAGHAWLVEVNAPEGLVCSVPISALAGGECGMRILYDHGIGYNGGGCDYNP
jgi:hypothetical protein